MSVLDQVGLVVAIVVVALLLGQIFRGDGPDDPVSELHGLPPFLCGFDDDEEEAA
jgi:hypothetical protein